MKLIGYIGASGSGKDYEASKLLSTGKYIQVNMADSVKSIVYNQINFAPATHYDYETFKMKQYWNDNRSYFTGRDLIKNLTNEINKLDPELWFKTWQKKIEHIIEDYIYDPQSLQSIVVTDIRYIQSLKYFFNFSNLTKTIYLCNYKSFRYQLHEDESEDLIRKILNEEADVHMTDITNYCRNLI